MAKVELQARISADAREFYRTMGAVAKSVKPVALGVAGGLGAGAGAIGASWAAAVASLVQYGSAIKDLQDKTGLGAETIQKLGYAAKQTGGDMDSIAPAMRGLADKLMQAKLHSKTAQAAFTRLGLSWRELAQASPDAQIETVLEAIANVADPTKRAALAADVLGKSGQALIPVALAYEQLGDRAKKLGLLLPQEQVNAADRLGDAMTDLHRKVQAVGYAAVGPDLGRMAATIERITANPAVWNAIAPALRVASAAMADFVVQMGAMLQDKDTLAAISASAANIADGFAYAVDGATRLTEAIKPMLELVNGIEDGLRIIFETLLPGNAAATDAERRMSGLGQFSSKEQQAAAVKLRDMGITLNNSSPENYQASLQRTMERTRAEGVGPDAVTAIRELHATIRERMPAGSAY